MKILAVGDIVGENGVAMFNKSISKIKKDYGVDFTIVNAENSSGGRGITRAIYNDIVAHGADAITMGNHTWGRKDIFDFIEDANVMVRPANYADELPGVGYRVFNCKGKKIGVINLIGRVDMGSNYECPFKKSDEIVADLKSKGTDIIVIDFHAEATAEKIALAYYLEGRINVLYGTHTHVQTNDDSISEAGVGYITDIGMTGPKDSIIGMQPKAALKRFLTQIPERYVLAEGKCKLNAVVFTIDDNTGKVTEIQKIKVEE